MKTEHKKIKNLEQQIKNLEKKIKRLEEITVMKSVIKNVWTWVAIFTAIYSITDNYVNGILTFFILFFFSYYVHLDCHKYEHLFTKPHKYHHDHDNFFSHFIQYVIELGSIPSFFLIIYSICGTIFLDKWVILFVSLLYSTVHNINYSYFKVNNVHKLHHENEMTNIGPDLCDIMFGTKHPDNEEVEDTNHYIPNVILITLMIIWLKRMCLNEPFNTLFTTYSNYFLMGCFVFYILVSIGLHFH
jgi:hypothetical protein